SPMGSVYKGLALGNNGLLYAANFGLGRVDVFNSNFQQTTVSGGFKDNTLPAGYAPFDVKSVGGLLYVTYALQDAKHHDDVSGPGHGFIDVFDTNGVLQQRLVSHGALNSPWGMAIAPSTFGAFSNDLLVGNFGDGKINAFNPTTGAFLGTLDGGNGSPIVIQGLWGLSFGNGAFGQNLDSLYFTAGIPGMDNIEDHGLFGSITAAPEPAPVFSMGIAGLALLVVSLARRRRRNRAGAGELA
ncbi:MAG: TIGR03118 family protein, partial [Acidobacteriaceae bacterium]|nr:TIGR03118 family protein [Acidobacteriaceae bacterium]